MINNIFYIKKTCLLYYDPDLFIYFLENVLLVEGTDFVAGRRLHQLLQRDPTDASQRVSRGHEIPGQRDGAAAQNQIPIPLPGVPGHLRIRSQQVSAERHEGTGGRWQTELGEGGLHLYFHWSAGQ